MLLAESDRTWTRVGGPRKSKAKKQAQETAPAANGAPRGGPIATTNTAFAQLDAWRPAEPARAASPDRSSASSFDSGDETAASTSARAAAPAAAAAAPKPPKKPKVKKVKVAIAEVAEGLELRTTISALREKYASDAVAQLESLASFLDVSFAPCELPFLKTLQEKPLLQAAEVPLNQVGEGFVAPIAEFVSGLGLRDLGTFACTCLDAVLDGLPDAPGGKSPPPKAKVGLLLMLAVLLRTQPVTLVLLSQHLLDGGALYTSPGRLPVLLWVLCQASRGDPAVGVAVWARSLLPQVLGVPCGLAPSKPSADGGVQRAPNAAQTMIVSYVGDAIAPALPSIRMSAAHGLDLGDAAPPAANGKAKGGSGAPPPRLPAVPVAALDALARAVSHLDEVPCAKGVRAWLPGAYEALRGAALGARADGFAYAELLRASLDAASAPDAPPQLVALCAANVAACMAADGSCFGVWESRHKHALRGSARVLASLAGSYPGPLAPLLVDRRRRAALASSLRELRARHRSALTSGKGWQRAAAASADDAASALLRRVGGGVVSSALRCGDGGRGALAAALLLGTAALGGVALLVAKNEEAGLAAMALLGPTPVAQLRAGVAAAEARLQPLADAAAVHVAAATAAAAPYAASARDVAAPYAAAARDAATPYVVAARDAAAPYVAAARDAAAPYVAALTDKAAAVLRPSAAS